MTHETTGIDADREWVSSLEGAFGVLLGRPLSEHDADAEYEVFYGGNWLDESESDRDAVWLNPAALAGRETITMEHLMLLDEVGFPELRFDAASSLFEVDPNELPAALAADLESVSPYSRRLVRGRDLTRLLDRHDIDLTAPDLSGAWCVRQARIASDGTLLDALRVATGIGTGPDSLVPHSKPHIWDMGTEAAADAIPDPRLRAHLRTFCEPGSHTLDHQAEATRSGRWSDWQEGEWVGIGTLVTQWLGAVDQYAISVVRTEMRHVTLQAE